MVDAVTDWSRKNYFLLRRLHSLSGIVPIGAFLIEHLFTNSMAFIGPATYNEHVHAIHNLPYLLMLEILFIFAPLAYHIGFGIVIARLAKYNVNEYPYFDNWRYTLQRWTGYITFVYIILHLIQFRFAHWFGGPVFVGAADPFKVTLHGFSDYWLPFGAVLLMNSIGLLAAVYHFCNGIVTFCIRWGITVGDLARKRVGVGAVALGLVLAGWGFASLVAVRNAIAGGPDSAAVTAERHPGE